MVRVRRHNRCRRRAGSHRRPRVSETRLRPNLKGAAIWYVGAWWLGVVLVFAAADTRLTGFGLGLMAPGARLAIGDIDEAALAEAAAAIGAAHHCRVDVADPESFRRFLAEAEACVGPVDVLINNAGIMPAGPFLEESDEMTRRIFEINTI